MEEYSNHLGEGRGGDVQELGHPPFFGPLRVRIVMAPVDVMFSMLMHYCESIMSLKVHWKSDPQLSWTCVVLSSFCLFVCFPPSLQLPPET